MSGAPWVLPSPRPCYPPCEQRLLAVIDEEIMPARSLGGWVMPDAPLRQKSWRAQFYHPETPDCTGRPLVLTVCPWCGGELPPPSDDDWFLGDDDGC